MLALRDVVAGYSGAEVLHGVTLVAPRSAVTVLLGPNGAGKTTLLRVASGLLHATSGRVELDGDDVRARAPHDLVARGVCHVPEARGVFPSLTVRENLALFAATPEAMERALDAFPQLGARTQQTAGTLSGGERQMLALARAYASAPRLVLLDEVSMGLAPIIVDQIYVFLRRLAAEGVALLLVEQYVGRALELADYVYLLNRGEMSFAGEPAELDRDEIFNRYLGTKGVHDDRHRSDRASATRD